MSTRAHGAEEPGSEEPCEPDATDADDAHDGSATARPDDATAPEDAMAPEEVDARFSDLVARLEQPADPRGWAPDPDLEEAENHFVPPDPGPVLGGDPLKTMAWGAVIGVPVLFLVLAVAWRDAPTWLLQAAGVAFLAGAGLLVWRMPHERDEDDRGTGAVV